MRALIVVLLLTSLSGCAKRISIINPPPAPEPAEQTKTMAFSLEDGKRLLGGMYACGAVAGSERALEKAGNDLLAEKVAELGEESGCPYFVDLLENLGIDVGNLR